MSADDQSFSSQSQNRKGRGALRKYMFRTAPDVIGLLIAQGEVSRSATGSFAEWSQGNIEKGQLVKSLEHQADDARRALLLALSEALSTPISQEDLYTLSERCDRVVNETKNIVSEAESLGWLPDAAAAEMGILVDQGMARLLDGFKALKAHPELVGKSAEEAIRKARSVEHAYRRAVALLFADPDFRVVYTSHEMYRSYARCADFVVAVADRLWYSVLAEG